MHDGQGASDGLSLADADRITLYFADDPMEDDTLFYADNFIMLPAWIQVLIHRCEPEELLRLVAKLRGNEN